MFHGMVGVVIAVGAGENDDGESHCLACRGALSPRLVLRRFRRLGVIRDNSAQPTVLLRDGPTDYYPLRLDNFQSPGSPAVYRLPQKPACALRPRMRRRYPVQNTCLAAHPAPTDSQATATHRRSSALGDQIPRAST